MCSSDLSVLALLDRLRVEYPGLGILVTTTTVTAARALAPRLPPGAIHQFVPADLLGPSMTTPLSLSADERALVGRLADGKRLAVIAEEMRLTIWEANTMKSSLEFRSRCRSVDDWRRLAILQGIDHRR